MLRVFREFLSWRQGTAIILAEANVLPQTDMNYFGAEGERLQMMFNFEVNQNLFYALATADTRPLLEALKATKLASGTCQWAHFLRNHDELDLGRLTVKQRQTVFAAFAPEPDMQLYDRGIRRRLTTMLQGDRRRIELAYSLMMTLPGTPVIRYGDEIGMGDDLRLPERQAARTPMQWSTEPHGGFTTSPKPVLPVISGGPYGFEHVNVADQRRDPNSLLNWMERIIRMRKEVPEIGWGDFTMLRTGTPEVVAIRYDWRNNSVVVVHNLSAIPREVWLDIGMESPERLPLVNLLSNDHSVADGSGQSLLPPRTLRVSVVSCRGAGLSPETNRCLSELLQMELGLFVRNQPVEYCQHALAVLVNAIQIGSECALEIFGPYPFVDDDSRHVDILAQGIEGVSAQKEAVEESRLTLGASGSKSSRGVIRFRTRSAKRTF